ncbi:MAG: N-acyl homoserine lactonase AiiB [Chloroflexota bacterium]
MGTKIRGLKVTRYGMDYELLVFPHPEFALMGAGRHDAPKTWYACPSLAYIIEHPDGLVLWETSLSERYLDEWLAPWQGLVDLSEVSANNLLEARLKQLGLGPEDFKYVIMGHLHCDHAGGLRLFEHSPAEIICHEDEHRYVMNMEDDGEFYLRADWNFLARKRPVTITGNQEIMKDLWLYSLPGHTAGSMGMCARLDHTGWMFLTSDAIYTRHSYGPPATGSPIVWDGAAWARSVEKVRRIATDRNAFVLPGHDVVGIQHQHSGTEFREVEYLPEGKYE